MKIGITFILYFCLGLILQTFGSAKTDHEASVAEDTASLFNFNDFVPKKNDFETCTKDASGKVQCTKLPTAGKTGISCLDDLKAATPKDVGTCLVEYIKTNQEPLKKSKSQVESLSSAVQTHKQRIEKVLKETTDEEKKTNLKEAEALFTEAEELLAALEATQIKVPADEEDQEASEEGGQGDDPSNSNSNKPADKNKKNKKPRHVENDVPRVEDAPAYDGGSSNSTRSRTGKPALETRADSSADSSTPNKPAHVENPPAQPAQLPQPGPQASNSPSILDYYGSGGGIQDIGTQPTLPIGIGSYGFVGTSLLPGIGLPLDMIAKIGEPKTSEAPTDWANEFWNEYDSKQPSKDGKEETPEINGCSPGMSLGVCKPDESETAESPDSNSNPSVSPEEKPTPSVEAEGNKPVVGPSNSGEPATQPEVASPSTESESNKPKSDSPSSTASTDPEKPAPLKEENDITEKGQKTFASMLGSAVDHAITGALQKASSALQTFSQVSKGSTSLPDSGMFPLTQTQSPARSPASSEGPAPLLGSAAGASSSQNPHPGTTPEAAEMGYDENGNLVQFSEGKAPTLWRRAGKLAGEVYRSVVNLRRGAPGYSDPNFLTSETTGSNATTLDDTPVFGGSSGSSSNATSLTTSDTSKSAKQNSRVGEQYIMSPGYLSGNSAVDGLIEAMEEVVEKAEESNSTVDRDSTQRALAGLTFETPELDSGIEPAGSKSLLQDLVVQPIKSALQDAYEGFLEGAQGSVTDKSDDDKSLSPAERVKRQALKEKLRKASEQNAQKAQTGNLSVLERVSHFFSRLFSSN